ncbi:OmpA family protein (plasmid) [Dermatophilaceae bacterium Sec6.4]
MPISFTARVAHCAVIGFVMSASMTLSGCKAPEDHGLILGVTASAAEPAPSLAPLVGALTTHAVGAVNPGGGAVKVVVGNNTDTPVVDLTPLRSSQEVEQDPDQAQKLVASKLRKLQAVLDISTPQKPGLDLMGLFRRTVQASSSGDSLLLDTSGVSTVDPLDLRVTGWSIDVASTVTDLRKRGLIPDARGRTVRWIGLGVTAGTQPELTLPEVKTVTDLALSVCRASGAVCSAESGDVPRTPPHSTQPVPVVTVGRTTTTCTRPINLPGDVLFDRGSTSLSVNADQALGTVAAQLATCPAGRVATITGHTSSELSGDHEFALSKARAVAVRARLLQLGVPMHVLGAAIGVGDTRQVVNNLPDGQRVDALAQLNQRVEITIK